MNEQDKKFVYGVYSYIFGKQLRQELDEEKLVEALEWLQARLKGEEWLVLYSRLAQGKTFQTLAEETGRDEEALRQAEARGLRTCRHRSTSVVLEEIIG